MMIAMNMTIDAESNVQNIDFFSPHIRVRCMIADSVTLFAH